MMRKERRARAKQFLWNMLASGKPVDYDLDQLRKYCLFNSAIFLGVIFLPLLGGLAYIQKDPLLCAVDLSVTLLLILIFFYLRKARNIDVVGIFGTIMIGVFYLFLVGYGGVEQSAHVWAFTYPLIALFLLGKRVGIYLALLFLLCCSTAFFLSTHYDLLTNYDATLIVRFIAAYLTICLLGIIIEFTREKIHHRLRTSKVDLETVLGELQKSSNTLTNTNEKLEKEITERKRVEKALRASERFLVDIIESIQDGIVVLDPDLTIRHANAVMARWYDQESSLVGKKCYECFYQRHQPCESCSTIRCLQSGKTERETIYLNQGSLIEVIEVYSFPIRDDVSGEITGAVEFLRDVTERKRLERQLAQAQKMEAVGTLAGGVAHDLNNILSGVVSYPDLLLMQLPADSPMRKNIQTIQKSGQKAAAIVQDLLTLARRGVPVHEVVNMEDIVSAFFISPEWHKIEEFHPKMTTKVEFQTGLLNLIGSPIHLSKCLTNLVSNGAEAMADGGMLTVEVYNQYFDKIKDGYEEIPSGQYVVLAVTDTGSGISPADLTRIFEPFYTKKKMGRSGTGLGMAVVWGSVKDHNGYIDIWSKVGQGAKFSLYFPVTREPITQQATAVPVEEFKGTGKILVVDDLSEQREIASAILCSLGYEVDSVSSGEEALEYLEQKSVDLVILDMVMEPGMDGLSTYAEIAKISPGQKAIIASGYSETARAKEAQRLGVGSYIKKPYTLEEIGIAVKRELSCLGTNNHHQ